LSRADTGPSEPRAACTGRDSASIWVLMPSLTLSEAGPGFKPPLTSAHCAYAASTVAGGGGTSHSQAAADIGCGEVTPIALQSAATQANTCADFIFMRTHIQRPPVL